MTSQETAKALVESILGLAEKASHKTLIFGNIVSITNGKVRGVQEVMVEAVEKALKDGQKAMREKIALSYEQNGQSVDAVIVRSIPIE